FFTNLAQFLFTNDIGGIAPMYWVAGFGIAAAPLMLSRDGLATLVRSPVAAWCLGFLAITCLWLVLQPAAPPGAWKELNARVLTVVSLVSMVGVFSPRDAVRWARWSVFVAVCLALALNGYELFNPKTFSE